MKLESEVTIFHLNYLLQGFDEILTEEIMPVLTQENEFEYQDESILKPHFGNFGLSGFSGMENIL